MTYAPATISALSRYWVYQGGVNLGIVGDVSHQLKGTSYHLGRDKLSPTAYSRQTARDKRGLTDGASAIDLGKLDGTYGNLRAFSSWLVTQCRTNKPGTADIREVIYSPDGRRVLRWDRERGVSSLPRPGEADDSHKWHTHISWYRDAEQRDHTITFRPYFQPPARYRVLIDPGATVRAYTMGTGGTIRCIASVASDTVWGPEASSAPASVGVHRKTCDGSSEATTTLVTSGVFKGKHIRVSAAHGTRLVEV